MDISHKDLIKFGVGYEKKRTLTVADRYIFRPIGFLILPSAFHYFKLTPNKISILSFFFAAVGFCIFFLSTNAVTILLGCLLCIIFMVMDCMDGTLARVLKQKYQIENPLGEFFDAFVGYFFVVGLWTSLGFYLSQINNDWAYLRAKVHCVQEM